MPTYGRTYREWRFNPGGWRHFDPYSKGGTCKHSKARKARFHSRHRN